MTTAGAAPNATNGTCLARGCREQARWVLGWNNPKLHTPDRRKTWLACDVHRQPLADFLAARGFLRDVVAVGEPGSGRQTLQA